MSETTVATVSRLMVGPVKGLRLHEPDSVELSATGAVGDRDFFLVDDDDTLLSITRTGALTDLRARYDGTEGRLSIDDGAGVALAGPVERGAPVQALFFGHHHVAGHEVPGPWAAYLSERIGQRVRLVRALEPNGGRDLHGITVMGDASADAVGDHAGESVDPRRFRMTIGLTGTPAFAEDDWVGSVLTVGTAELEMGGPVKRCAATARHPQTGERDMPMLRLLKSLRGLRESELGTGVTLGVYAEVRRPGTVCIGDPVSLSGHPKTNHATT